MKWIKERKPWRAELIRDCNLACDGKILVSASKDNPVPGMVTSHCDKKIGRNNVRMYRFHPDVAPDKSWEFSDKWLKKVKSVGECERRPALKKIKKVKLNTLDMYKNENITDCDYELWQKIAEFMNGETAFVIESVAVDGQYVFLGLTDAEKNKELFYMMEQDSMMGVYIDDREGFDKAWDNEEYEHDGCFYLEPQYLIFRESET